MGRLGSLGYPRFVRLPATRLGPFRKCNIEPCLPVNRLRRLLEALKENNGASTLRKAVEDATHRLALWGGNLGAFSQLSLKLSLESRLLEADAMDIHEEVM